MDQFKWSDVDLMTYLLNVECLEGAFDTYGAFGHNMHPDLFAGGPPPIGGRKANLSDQIQPWGEEFFNAAFGRTGTNWDPYRNDLNFVLSLFTLEEVGATLSAGAVGLAALNGNLTVVAIAAGLAGSANYQSAADRYILWERRDEMVPEFNVTVTEFMDALSALRQRLTGPVLINQPLYFAGGRSIVPTDGNGVTLARTPQQARQGVTSCIGFLAVLHFHTLGSANGTGAFFPEGVRGRINRPDPLQAQVPPDLLAMANQPYAIRLRNQAASTPQVVLQVATGPRVFACTVLPWYICSITGMVAACNALQGRRKTQPVPDVDAEQLLHSLGLGGTAEPAALLRKLRKLPGVRQQSVLDNAAAVAAHLLNPAVGLTAQQAGQLLERCPYLFSWPPEQRAAVLFGQLMAAGLAAAAAAQCFVRYPTGAKSTTFAPGLAELAAILAHSEDKQGGRGRRAEVPTAQRTVAALLSRIPTAVALVCNTAGYLQQRAAELQQAGFTAADVAALAWRRPELLHRDAAAKVASKAAVLQQELGLPAAQVVSLVAKRRPQWLTCTVSAIWERAAALVELFAKVPAISSHASHAIWEGQEG
ncbi:hypothetical protein COHA_008518 [Chlorella ohadii]|uniref:Uncharacterized protein n=1 Tax=Chlorella ohadii TaxID=2649997 RepID=A0AAD5DIP0_9CHLO|nr:hypothetical protein COHA_008518 [Chlorella ohadii]